MKGRWHFVACAVAAGIAAASFHLDWKIALLPVALSLFFVLWKAGTGWIAIICSLAFFLAFCYFHFIDLHNTSHLSSQQSRFSGEIVSLPELDGNHFVFQLKAKNGEKIRVVDNFQDHKLIPALKSYRYGMTCHIEGELKEPQADGNFYGFDYRQYLHQEKIHWQLTPKSLQQTSCIAGSYSVYDRLQQWRGAGIRWVEAHFPEDSRGISEALLFGERSNIDEDVTDSYQDLGIIHLLAVSGLHVGLVVGALYFLMIRIGVTKERTLVLLFFLLPLYIIMTGAAPSAVRAGCMAMIVLAALRFQHLFHPLDGVSWVAVFMLAVNPYALFQVGFQLSFLISFSLIVSAPFIQRRYHTRLGQLVAISAVSQLMALPILLVHFYSISLLSLPLNLIFIPFVSFFVLPLAFLSFFASLIFPLLGQLLVSLLAFVLHYAHGLLLAIHNMSWGTLVFGKPSVWMVLLLYAVIFYGLLKWETGRTKRRLAGPAATLVFVCLLQWYAPYLWGEGKVTMLDVGQGDGFLIELPHRKAVYMIDTGGTVKFGEKKWQQRKHSFKVGKDIVLPELKARGIRKIDRLILTHGDRDHIGGAEGLLGHVRIGEILYGDGKIEIPFVQQLLTRAQQTGSRIVYVKEGMSWKVGGQSFTVLNPTGGENDNNARSIVIAARLGGLSWLFTGDLEKEGELRLEEDYPNLRVDVLKAGHHGSKTSSSESFISQIDPEVALISAGLDNMYGHPNDEVVKRFRAHHIKMLRTDLQGAVQFRFGGKQRSFDWVLHDQD